MAVASFVRIQFRAGRTPFLLVTPPPDCYDFIVRPTDPIPPARLRGLRLMPEPKTILVVDDDVELSDGLRMVLERQGYRVIQARDGQQGQKQVYQQRPDLVILDMMMPRMGGYPVLEHFRDKPDAPPIIMITANEGSRHKAYAEYLGVVDYIRKPFAIERLLEAVERGLKSGDAPADLPTDKKE
jgi:DNA-binding response OmpR family regulator